LAPAPGSHAGRRAGAFKEHAMAKKPINAQEIQDGIAKFMKSTAESLACVEGIQFLDDMNNILDDDIPTEWEDENQKEMYRDLARIGFDMLLATMKIMKDRDELVQSDSSDHDASRN
jgi:hypothetical protein